MFTRLEVRKCDSVKCANHKLGLAPSPLHSASNTGIARCPLSKVELYDLGPIAVLRDGILQSNVRPCARNHAEVSCVAAMNADTRTTACMKRYQW